ncbi:MAG: sterol desaturase family protein [Rhodococcus sp. (in: high G+C Gram-positive bacteria)]
MIADAWNSLPALLRDPVALAVPAFLILLALEWSAAIVLERQESAEEHDRPRRGSYLRADARASISIGLVSIVTTTGWKTVALLGYSVIYAYLAPWHLPSDQWYTWAILLVGVDVLFYWYHRIAHRTRIVWATHQAHHSSEYFNFSTALRQKWNNSGEILMWLPLPLLGVPPWMVFTGFAINLVYQFWVHTERIGRLPRWFEFVFNTPSHHRVHHGNDSAYLDKNYAGMLIVWDRLFGTFTPETSRPHYGLTTPVDTFDILKLQTHEYAAIGRDVRSAGSLRHKMGYIFGPPGWTPNARNHSSDAY